MLTEKSTFSVPSGSEPDTMRTVDRKHLLAPVKRVVVKIGSGVLTRRGGLNLNLIDDLATEICQLRAKGMEVILVSSGAIAAGMRRAGLNKRSQSLSEMQALAALGQSSLITVYEEVFTRHGVKAAQILLTRDDLTNRRRYLNARNTLFTLLAWRIVPVINENDTVVVDEIRFGDNDNLSAMVTNLTDAHLLVNLTTIDGLYDRDPRQHADARHLALVTRVDRRISRMASEIPGFLGTGGMASKLAAAQKVALGGVPTVIADGRRPAVLKDIFGGKDIGTLFLPQQARLCSRKHWIAFTKTPRGELTVDAGAERALRRNGKSLLPSGILAVTGRFSKGNAVTVRGTAGEPFAVGMTNYNSGELKRIIGANTSQIESRLGYKHDDEVIHRDNLVFASQMG